MNLLGIFIACIFVLSSSHAFAAVDMQIRPDHELEIMLNLEDKDFYNKLNIDLVNPERGVYEWRSKRNLIFQDEFGVSSPPSITSRVIRRTKDKIVYDVIYNHDQYGRRVSFGNDEDYEEGLVLYGCSFAYGEGLNDDKTISSHINKSNSKIYSYNYGIRGTGPNVFLSHLQKKEIPQRAKSNTLHSVFLFWQGLLHRVVPMSQTISFTEYTPAFKKEGDRLVRDGTVKDHFYIRTFIIEAFLKVLPKSLTQNRNFPPFRSAEYDYFCSILKEIKHLISSKSKEGRHAIYFHIFSKRDESIVKCTKDLGFEAIFPSEETLSANPMNIEIDGHPSAELNRLIAQDIIKHFSSLP